MNIIWTDSEVRIEGLETLDYLDNLFQKERFTEQGDALTFESEVIMFFQNLLSLLVAKICSFLWSVHFWAGRPGLS